jgi:SAM-dependent methyltransferase
MGFRAQALDEIFSQLPSDSGCYDVLEVGCGSGEIYAAVSERPRVRACGLDRDRDLLVLARKAHPGGVFIEADAHRIPFPDDSFQLVYCHLALLWMADPSRVIREMIRVTNPGGVVAALAEPDYAGRVDYPVTLPYRDLIINGLLSNGAHPRIGSALPSLFRGAGLSPSWSAVLFTWGQEDLLREFDEEWKYNERCFGDHFTNEELARAKEEERAAIVSGTRVIAFPLFRAFGVK